MMTPRIIIVKGLIHINTEAGIVNPAIWEEMFLSMNTSNEVNIISSKPKIIEQK